MAETVFTDELLKEAFLLYESGMTYRALAIKYRVDTDALHKAMDRSRDSMLARRANQVISGAWDKNFSYQGLG